jgi:hypothetical protein
MKLRLTLLVLLLGFSSSVAAGPFNDKLAVCLVKSSTEADRTILMRWIFVAMANHPGVKDLAPVSKEVADKLNKDMAGLFWSLISDRCGAETKEAVKYEGASALSASFEVLGKVAMQGLMADADVSKYIAGVDTYLDKDAMKALLGSESADVKKK